MGFLAAGDIGEKRFCLLLSMLPFRGLSVCLSVCLSVMFVHCAQTAEDTGTISFAYEITKNLAYTGQPLRPHILPQSDPPLLI